MRKALKILHSLASCGLIGALVAYGLVLSRAPQAAALPEGARQFADMRGIISALCDYVLVPSLALALVTGLVAMIVHRPFQEMRWVWLKAVMGFALFESTLAITQAKAGYAATFAERIAQAAAGADIAEARAGLAEAMSSEWTALGAITALCVAQVIVGVWRPAMKGRARAR
jgi:hypothetical protein